MTDLPLSGIIFTLGLVMMVWFILSRLKSLLMFFQQEEYDGPRFIRWIAQENAFDRTLTNWILVSVVVLLLGQTQQLSLLKPVAILTFFAGLFHGIYRSYKLRKDNKKPLVMTLRARRIFQTSGALSLVVMAAFVFFNFGMGYSHSITLNPDPAGPVILWPSNDAIIIFLGISIAIIAQILPFMLTVGNKILAPIEARIKDGFRNEAKARLAEVSPKIIAITGSFGKTSTKHMLGHIMESAAPTLITPGSVNTDMGITRIIREKLRDDHQYFVVEMGAYGPGSIARLCNLTPPDVGLITAVGAAHYERFKSLDTVAQAKFELAEAVSKRDGSVIVAKDGIPSNLLDDRTKNVPANYVMVGADSDVKISDMQQTRDGIQFTLDHPQDGPQALKLPIYGMQQIHNAALAATAARAIGLPWSVIRAALATMPGIPHRMDVVRQAGQATIIDDAYNSNPIGFKAALECLDLLVDQGGRRILLTPGMVELGAEHDKAHRELGTFAAKHCDIIAAVTPERIPTFVDAVKTANTGVKLMEFSRQQDAEAWLHSEWGAGDAVLFENNLPDLYEAKVAF